VPQWVVASPSVTDCINGKINVLVRNTCTNATRMEPTSRDCGGEPVVDCNPAVVISGPVTQTCNTSNGQITVNGSALSATGGSGVYRWAIVRQSDFTNVDALAWGTAKSWIINNSTTDYFIYV